MRSSESNLSLPNQIYSCHSNWNWSNKSLSSPSDWFYLLPLFTSSLSSWSHCLLALPVWLHCVTTIVVWLHTIFHPDHYYLAAISLRAFTSLILDYGLPSVVYLPLHVNRFFSIVCLRNFHVLKTFIKIAYSSPSSRSLALSICSMRLLSNSILWSVSS